MVKMPSLKDHILGDNVLGQNSDEMFSNERFYIQNVKPHGRPKFDSNDLVFYQKTSSNDPGYYVSIKAQLTKYARRIDG
jgi:hypothetical protein